jgi:hypothetical protein
MPIQLDRGPMSVRRSTVKYLLLLLLFLTAGVPLWAFRSPLEERKLPSFPESVYTRRLYLEKITAPISEAVKIDSEMVNEPGERSMIRVMAEEKEQEVFFYFSQSGDFEPAVKSQGDYVFVRNGDDGSYRYLRIYLKSGEESYLEIRPADAAYSTMNIILLDTLMQEDIRVSFSLEELLQISFRRLMESTVGYVNWSFYLPDPLIAELGRVDVFAQTVRPSLPSIAYGEDGGMNEEGTYVYIEDGRLQDEDSDGKKGGLNCSGFAKWVVDGIYYLKTGSFLSIDELKKTHPDSRGNRWSEKYEELREPYFGLDWTRNLALSLLRLSEEDAKIEAADVDKLVYHEYEEDLGYPVRELPSLLYELAVSEPDYFYLGSVNGVIHGEGELRSHYHVVVFLPWIDRFGRLQISVMENADETPLENFIAKYEREYVHLVRIETDGGFIPPSKALDPVLRR